MAKQKKDGRHINYYLDRKVYDALAAYAEEKGQTMTMALERILKAYLRIDNDVNITAGCNQDKLEDQKIEKKDMVG